MPDRTRKPKSRDLNRRAWEIVQMATGEAPPLEEQQPTKNAAAVELGRLGGLKGGAARAAKMTPEQRRESARKAAAARWNRAK
jgi:hypothetical protein